MGGVEIRGRRVAVELAILVLIVALALEALARRPLIRAMDLNHCDPQLADLNELYGRPANIVVINLQGRIICGATMPPRNVVLLTADEDMLRAMKAKPGFRLS